MSPGRRRAQSGTTLVELLVSLVIIGVALSLIIGTLSSGLLQAVLVKRNVGIQAATQFEMEKVQSSPFDPQALPFSDCFAADNTATPTPANAFQGSCPSGYTLRVDVSCQQPGGNLQLWQIVTIPQPGSTPVGAPISLYKTLSQ